MDVTKFVVIYPSYLDSTKTIAQGRRIGQEHAVETPSVSDISQALETLKIRHVLQPYKGYPRDIETLWDNPGRVKVEPPAEMSKRGVLVELGKIIPTLPNRIQRLEQAKQQADLEAKKQEEESSRARQAQSQLQQQQQLKAASNKSNKKKGKKKR
jgi:signal recognition particle subunit SRP19